LGRTVTQPGESINIFVGKDSYTAWRQYKYFCWEGQLHSLETVLIFLLGRRVTQPGDSINIFVGKDSYTAWRQCIYCSFVWKDSYTARSFFFLGGGGKTIAQPGDSINIFVGKDIYTAWRQYIQGGSNKSQFVPVIFEPHCIFLLERTVTHP
jgi:predicted secreted protein